MSSSLRVLRSLCYMPVSSFPCHVQIFKVQYDISRSAKFPVAAHFSNLRGILANRPRLDEVVATACSGIAVSPTKTSMRSSASNACVNPPPWSMCVGVQAHYAVNSPDLPHLPSSGLCRHCTFA